jgi:hypothetical protein
MNDAGKEQSFVLIGLKKLIFAFIWTNNVNQM